LILFVYEHVEEEEDKREEDKFFFKMIGNAVFERLSDAARRFQGENKTLKQTISHRDRLDYYSWGKMAGILQVIFISRGQIVSLASPYRVFASEEMEMERIPAYEK